MFESIFSGPGWLLLVGGAAIAIVLALFIKVLRSYRRARERPARTFWNAKYAQQHSESTLLVARYLTTPLEHRLTVMDINGTQIAELKNTTGADLHFFTTREQKKQFAIPFGKPFEITLTVADQPWRCRYDPVDRKRRLTEFQVNDDTPIRTMPTEREFINGEYFATQGEERIGVIYTESNFITHYALMSLLPEKYPPEVRALMLIFESRRYWHWPGMPTGSYDY